MKSTVETLSPTRVKIEVEVPFAEIKPSFDAAYKTLGSQVRIPGFRPGKVPGRVLEQRLGRGAVLEQVVNDALPKAYNDALEANDITPLTQPDVQVTKVEDDSFEFTAEMDVRPTIEIPDLSAVQVTVDDITVGDHEIETQLSSLRERFSTLKGVERAAATGDFVSIDLVATVDGTEVEGGSTTGLSHEVGSGQLIEGLDEALVGMTSEEEKNFQTELVAGDNAGQTADVKVTVRSVKEKELPDLDDDFAALASEFDTLDELREDLRGRVARVKDMTRVSEARDKVIEALIEQTDIPVPDSALQGEVDARSHDAIHAFDHDDAAFAAYLEEQGKTREEFDAETRTTAEKSIRAQLLLDAIADREEVGVDENELTAYLVQQAQRYDMPPQQFAEELQKANQVGSLVADVRRNKALSFVLAAATVTDSSGEPLDLEAIQAEAQAALAGPAPATDDLDDDDLDEIDDEELDAELDEDLEELEDELDAKPGSDDA